MALPRSPSPQPAAQTQKAATAPSGRKVVRELFGLALLFWGLFVLLTLITFSHLDPGINHVISAATPIQNSGGMFGAYVGGLLVDLFGFAAFVWPLVFLAWGAGCVSTWFTMPWWRWFGFFLLGACLVSFGSATSFGVGDVRGGGMLGASLYGWGKLQLSPAGASLGWLFMMFMATELAFGVSWMNFLQKGWDIARQKAENNDITLTRIGGALTHTLKRYAPVRKADEPVIALLEINTDQADGEPKPMALSYADVTGAALAEQNSIRETAALAAQNAYEAARQAVQPTVSQPTPPPTLPTLPLLPPPLPGHRPSEPPIPDPFADPALLAKLRDGTQDQPKPPEQDPLIAIMQRLKAETERERLPDLPLGGDSTHHMPMPVPMHPEATIPDGFLGQAVSSSTPSSSTPSSLPTSSSATSSSGNSFPANAVLPPPTHMSKAVDLSKPDKPARRAPDSSLRAADASRRPEAAQQTAAQQTAAPQNPIQHAIDHVTSHMGGHIAGTAARAGTAGLMDGLVHGVDGLMGGMRGLFQTNSAHAPQNNDHSATAEPVISPRSTIPEPQPERRPEPVPAPQLIPQMTHQPAPQPVTNPEPACAPAVARPVPMAPAATPIWAEPKMQLPPLSLLQNPVDSDRLPDMEIMAEKGEQLMTCLGNFGIRAELVRITPGPVVTMFEIRPAPGTKVARILNLNQDLALALKAISVRIHPIPGQDTLGVEIPNIHRATVNFRRLLESPAFQNSESLLTLALGADIGGAPTVADLAKMPHLLVGGATGAGKSVCINTLLLSLLCKANPDELKLLMVDPKVVELAMYADLPHLIHPVVTETQMAKSALEWAVHEMEQRYNKLASAAVRNIAGYNQKIAAGNLPPDLAHLEPMPYLVIVVDELSDLMLSAGKDVETAIVRLAQLARACGIHLIIATQRPSVDVVTGLIKANFPSRIAFQVTSAHDSRTILDTIGAELLLGKGDMLFKPSGSKPRRLHGPFASDEDVQAVVDFWKSQRAPDYALDFSEWGTPSAEATAGAGSTNGMSEEDALYAEILQFALEEGKKLSISKLQRRFRIGFNKAARFMERMEQDGIIQTAGHANRSREIL